MSKPKKEAFELRLPLIKLADILPVRQVKETDRDLNRYKTIASSIKEIGLLEPLVVYPQSKPKGKYILLDGHTRVDILKGLLITA